MDFIVKRLETEYSRDIKKELGNFFKQFVANETILEKIEEIVALEWNIMNRMGVIYLYKYCCFADDREKKSD